MVFSLKKTIFLILILFPFSVFVIGAEKIVMDGDSGRVLFAKDIHKQKLIASVTKIMIT